ncbi:MAG: Lrp/AsnC ligand binding domain-containing protein [Candidatus Thorarchaeota archaeon]|nr:MAG: Lrp/AsnC ligand binding domain-containing protein [Candidatus Thorarchaeota archaeon]
MTRTYVLIRAKAGTMWNVRSDIEKIEGIVDVHVITGPYDLVALVNLPSTDNLKRLLEIIHDVEGVVSTETWIAM